MSTNIKTGAMVNDLSLLVNNQSNKPPFQAPFGLSVKTYIAGDAAAVAAGTADFVANEDLIIEVLSSPGLRYASFTGLDGSVITYTKADHATKPTSYTLTLTAPAASVRSLIYFDI